MEFLLILYFGIPIMTLIWFFSCLSEFLHTHKESELRRKRKIWFIISTVTAAICVGLNILITSAFFIGLRNM